MSGFWRNWMMGWCWAVGLFGVVLMGGALDATSGPTRLLYGVLNPAAEFRLDQTMRFSLAVLGAVTLGWSLTLFAAIQAAHQLGDRAEPTWCLIILSVAVWYVIDSGLSIATGFSLNTIPNTVFLAAFLLPILKSGVLRG
jgi:hypothetical protein